MFTVNEKDTGAVDKKRTNKQTKKFIETSSFDILLLEMCSLAEKIYNTFCCFHGPKIHYGKSIKKTDIMFHLFAQVVAF